VELCPFTLKCRQITSGERLPLERILVNPKQDSRLEELIDPLLGRGLSLRIRATGSSMTPFICSGEFVILRRVPPTRLSIGDVILFINHAGNLVLHRIIHISRETGSGGESVPFRNGWRIQTKGDAAGVDPPISANNVLAKVVCIEKSTPFLGFQHLRLESLLWKLYGIAIVLAVSVKSSALGSFLRPFYRSAKALRNRVFNFSRSGSLTLASGCKDCPARVRAPVSNEE
jgi:signal peptidase I